MVVKMRKFLGALALIVGLVGPLWAQEVVIAPSIAREDVPVKIRSASGSLDARVMIFDKFGNLVYDKETTLTQDEPLEWWGETNGGRKVDSGQYRIIVLIKDPEGYYRKAELNVDWIAVFR